MILRLNCDFSLFSIAPAYYTLQPNYSLSPSHPNNICLQGKCKTTPVELIPFKKIVKQVFKVNHMEIPNKFKIIDPQLYIEVYNQNLKTQNLVMKTRLDGEEYLYVTGAPKDGFWRSSLNFLFTIKMKKCEYQVQIIDDRDFSNIETIYSAGNIIFPDVRFIAIGANEIITTDGAIDPVEA